MDLDVLQQTLEDHLEETTRALAEVKRMRAIGTGKLRTLELPVTQGMLNQEGYVVLIGDREFLFNRNETFTIECPAYGETLNVSLKSNGLRMAGKWYRRNMRRILKKHQATTQDRIILTESKPGHFVMSFRRLSKKEQNALGQIQPKYRDDKKRKRAR